jgi:hypothetical protein
VCIVSPVTDCASFVTAVYSSQVLLLGVYVVWVMLMAVDANGTLMGEHTGTLIVRRKKLAVELTGTCVCLPVVRRLLCRILDAFLAVSLWSSCSLFGACSDRRPAESALAAPLHIS